MLTISFRTDNASFTDNPVFQHTETARILREIARKIDAGYSNGAVRDANGNTIGSFEFERAS
jgi:hypothetical protein